MAKVHTPRNKDLAPGIGRYSRSAIYKKRALYKRKKTGVKKEVVEEPKTRVKEVGGDKNGSTRVVPVKREVCIFREYCVNIETVFPCICSVINQ